MDPSPSTDSHLAEFGYCLPASFDSIPNKWFMLASSLKELDRCFSELRASHTCASDVLHKMRTITGILDAKPLDTLTEKAQYIVKQEGILSGFDLAQVDREINALYDYLQAHRTYIDVLVWGSPSFFSEESLEDCGSEDSIQVRNRTYVSSQTEIRQSLFQNQYDVFLVDAQPDDPEDFFELHRFVDERLPGTHVFFSNSSLFNKKNTILSAYLLPKSVKKGSLDFISYSRTLIDVRPSA